MKAKQRQVVGFERRKRLATWWWSLPEKERVRLRQQFIERVKTDPEFRAEVAALLKTT